MTCIYSLRDDKNMDIDSIQLCFLNNINVLRMISKALNLAKDTSRVDEVFIVSEVAEAFYEAYNNLNPPRVNLCRIVQASKILQ